MLRKNEGFILAELFLAFSVWILISGIFFPIFMQLNRQFTLLDREKVASHLLYEYLQALETEKRETENTTIIVKNIPYVISGNQSTEVCVQYDNTSDQTKTICESF
ncbi:hypothetical protein [Bacillus sp. 03113]|uniref:hypothetical protein n=1 Tax=Bacillus sp. 03113 TaxID=2578211 RepID=UPI00114129F2|nr:hypothetical protein [Bacillus sp. 03113]